jgi:probable phosphoglycerate mutase
MTVYLVRHAEAEGNLFRRCHGHFDGYLSPNGWHQLEKTREFFSRLPIQAVFSSDLYRAHQTAIAVAGDKEVKVTKELREMNLFSWEDRPWGDILYSDGEDYDRFAHHLTEFYLPGGETFFEVVARMNEAITNICAAATGDVAIVSHGLALRVFIQQFSKEILPHMDNASVTTLKYENSQFTLESYADNAYLGDLSTFAHQSWYHGAHEEVDFRFLPGQEQAREALNLAKAAYTSVFGAQGQKIEQIQNWLDERFRRNEVLLVYFKDTPVGLLAYDEMKSTMESGHISMMYLIEEYTGKGLGVQLLGQAISHYRAAGKQQVDLFVLPSNTRALRFYQKNEFKQIGTKTVQRELLALSRRIVPDGKAQ